MTNNQTNNLEDQSSDKILSVLLQNTYTKNEAIRRVRFLSDLIDFKLFKQNNSSELSALFDSFKNDFLSSSPNSAHFDEDLAFFKGLKEDFYDLFIPARVSEQIKQLEDRINKTKFVLVYLPFELPKEELPKLGVWFKQNLGSMALFDIIFDPNLIGGCALSVNGVFKDYSLRQKIADNRVRVLEQLTSFRKS